jgi:hypothetical protein
MTISKNVRRFLIVGVIVGMVVGAWAVWYVFYKPHRDVGSETAAYTLKSSELSEAFRSDTSAVSKYIDKAILLEGPVSAIEGTHLSFDNIICNMDSLEMPKLATLKVGDMVKVQGRLTTYNDLMEEIMLDHCVVK